MTAALSNEQISKNSSCFITIIPQQVIVINEIIKQLGIRALSPTGNLYNAVTIQTQHTFIGYFTRKDYEKIKESYNNIIKPQSTSSHTSAAPFQTALCSPTFNAPPPAASHTSAAAPHTTLRQSTSAATSPTASITSAAVAYPKATVSNGIVVISELDDEEFLELSEIEQNIIINLKSQRNKIDSISLKLEASNLSTHILKQYRKWVDEAKKQLGECGNFPLKLGIQILFDENKVALKKIDDALANRMK